jgi:hypothetical protein
VVFSAAAIIIGLGAAVFFVIKDILDEKINACMMRHFNTTGMFQNANITIDPSLKFNYSEEDCKWIVEEGRAKTLKYINSLTVPECYRERFRDTHLESMMFSKVLDKAGFNSTLVMVAMMTDTKKACDQPLPN